MNDLLKTNSRLVLGISTALSLFSSAAAAATATTNLTPAALCDPASVSIYKFDKTDDSKPKEKLEIGVLTCKPKAGLDKEFIGTAVFYPVPIGKAKEGTLKEQSTVIEQTIKHGAFDSPDTRLMFLPNETATYQCKIIDISEPYKTSGILNDKSAPPLDLSNFKAARTNCDGLIKHGGQLYAAELGRREAEVKRHEAGVKLNIDTAFAAYQQLMNAPASSHADYSSVLAQLAWPYKFDFGTTTDFSARFSFPAAPANVDQPEVGSAPKEPVNVAQPPAQPSVQPAVQPPTQPSQIQRVFFDPRPFGASRVALVDGIQGYLAGGPL